MPRKKKNDSPFHESTQKEMNLKPRRNRNRNHTPGLLGCAPIQGRTFFVHDKTRLTRTWTMGQLPVPKNWRQVTAEEYDAFREATAKLPRKKQLELFSQSTLD